MDLVAFAIIHEHFMAIISFVITLIVIGALLWVGK